MKVLVIEDEVKIASLIERGLTEAGIDVTVCHDGERGHAAAASGGFDAIVLDIMLPDRDGRTILGDLRRRNLSTPVIFLTALDDLDDRVRGLASGADDYLTKPFYVEELIARLHAVTRRGREPASVLEAGMVRLDLLNREAFLEGEPIDLTAREFALLQYLMQSSGRVLTRAQILERVWNYTFDPSTNIVDVYIRRLRKKLGAARNIIETVRGVGYCVTRVDAP